MKKFYNIIAIFALLFSFVAHAEPVPTTPVVGGGGGAAEVFNDLQPMPSSLDWLQSPGAMKAHILINLIKSGSTHLNGSFVQLDNNKNVRLYGETALTILSELGSLQYKLSMPKKSAIVNVFCELFDEDGYGRAQSSGQATPVLQPDGTYKVSGNFELEMQDAQPMFFPGVTQAVISNEYGSGYSNGINLGVWGNGKVSIPMSALEQPGYLMLVREEPVDGGGTRKVSYGYQIGTGLSVHMIDVLAKATFSLKNYWEKDDVGLPLFLAGQSVPLYVQMYAKAPVPVTGDGWYYHRNSSQPAARLKVTVPGRVVALSMGCFNADGSLLERGRDLKIRNMKTGEMYSLNPDASGTVIIALPPGTYGVWYTLNALGVQRG